MNNNISINMKLDGNLYYGDKTVLDCNCSRDKYPTCNDYDTRAKLSFEIKYNDVIVLIGEFQLYQDSSFYTPEKVFFEKVYLSDEDNDDDKKDFIDIEPTKTPKEYSSISPKDWHEMLLQLKNRVGSVLNNNKQIICQIYGTIYQSHLEEAFNGGIDFGEIIDRMYL